MFISVDLAPDPLTLPAVADLLEQVPPVERATYSALAALAANHPTPIDTVLAQRIITAVNAAKDATVHVDWSDYDAPTGAGRVA